MPAPNAGQTPIRVWLSAGWRDFRNLVEISEFRGRYRQAMSQATATNGGIMLGEVRANIKTGKYAKGRKPNSSLTVFIKGFHNPLVDTGVKLRRLFEMVQTDYKSVEVGIKDNADAKWVAAIHDGATIKITPEMRNMFALLARASTGDPNVNLTGRAAELWARRPGGWHPLADNKKTFRIPRRPFFAEVINNKKLQEIVAYNWQIAGANAVAGIPVNYSTFRRP